MDDRTMLELAAKAAGIDLEFRVLRWSDGSEYPCYVDKDSVSTLANTEVVVRWNPLENDGQALRMAVKLQIDFQFEDGNVVTWFSCHRQGWDNGQVWSWEESLGDDSLSATRRAITRAAAAIQLAKESGK